MSSTAELFLLADTDALDAARQSANARGGQGAAPSPPCYFGVGGMVSNAPADPVPPPSFTAPEECLIVTFYARMIKELCGPKVKNPKLRRQDRVPAAANCFLRRFYLSNSVIDYDPLKVMVASIFLASKAEDLMISSVALSNATKDMNKEVTVEDIVGHEVLLLSGLGFQLHLSHPNRGVTGLVDDLRKFAKAEELYNGQDLPDFVALHTKAGEYLDDCVFSDLTLLYSPGKLSIIAVWLALLDLKKNDKGAAVKKEEEDEVGGAYGASASVPKGNWSKMDLKGYIAKR